MMDKTKRIRYEIFVSSELIGHATPDGPKINLTNWVLNNFEPTEAFDRYKSIFDHQNEIWSEIDRKGHDPEIIERLENIAKQVDDLDIRIRCPGGDEFGMHAIYIHDGHVDWRSAEARSDSKE
jgi:hypothetical protein